MLLSGFNQEIYEKGLREEGWEAGIAEGRKAGIAEGREAGIAEGRENGIAEGREEGYREGIKEGVEQGKAEEKEHAIINMLDLGLSEEQISQKYSKELVEQVLRETTKI
ncbi:Essential protein Yae1, N terminal [Lachnospiraceae bacterium C10]|nr:Essential protein Yae1, N terminal [Lachnospiraceae bacterium C10]